MALKPYRSTGHWKKLRLQVLRRDGFTCVYCGDVADQVDHVYPKSKGGEDTLENCVADVGARQCSSPGRGGGGAGAGVVPARGQAISAPGRFAPPASRCDSRSGERRRMAG